MQAGSIPSNIYKGASVSACQTLGKVGSTGNSTGPHLHFAISIKTIFCQDGNINPLNETYIYSSSPTEQPSLTVDTRYPTPFKAHAFNLWTTSNGKTPVYTSVNGIQDGNIYNGYNSSDDECTIQEVYTNGWCKVSVPGINGVRYCLVSVFTSSGYTPRTQTISQRTITYTRHDMATSYGYTDAGDTVTIVGESGAYTQIVYPLSAGGYKCGWISLNSGSSNQVDTRYPTPFKAKTLALWNTSDGKTPVYSSINGAQSGNIYNGYNNGDDLCTIEEVYTDGWCKVTVPGLSGYRYCRLSVFVEPISGYNIWNLSAPAYAVTYERSGDSSSQGYIDAGDAIYILAENEKRYQIIYPTANNRYCRWVNKCDLRHNYTTSITAPTCSAQGYTTHTCSVCGYSYKDNYTNATGHHYTYSTTQKPTASASGVITGVCNGCSNRTTVTLPKLDTTNYDYFVVDEATCSEEGVAVYTWKTTTYGDVTVTTQIPATGHSYTYKVTATPSTVLPGVLTGTCSKCSDTKAIALPRLNTTDYTYAVTKTATCDAAGTGRYTWKTTTYGSVAVTTQIPATGHSYTYKVTTNPTVSTAGTLTGTCSKCSGTTTVALPKLDTTNYTYVVTKQPTYTDAGIGTYTWKTTAYGTYRFTAPINKLTAVLNQITIASMPNKTVYIVGEKLDTAGLTLKAAYSDGSVKTISSGFTTSEFDSTAAGIKTITVSYGGKSTTFSVTVNPQTSSASTKITVDSASVRPGQSVQLKVRLTNNPGFSYLKLVAIFDSSKFEFIGAENGAIADDDFEVDRKNILFGSAADAKSDGLLVTLTFRAKDDAEEGSYTLGVRVAECFNENEDEVSMAVENGTVKVVKVVYGDATGDGKIDGRDMIRLKKYLVAYDDETGESPIEITAGADCNGDGKIDGRDMVRLKKYLANYDDETGSSTIVLGPQ